MPKTIIEPNTKSVSNYTSSEFLKKKKLMLLFHSHIFFVKEINIILYVTMLLEKQHVQKSK